MDVELTLVIDCKSREEAHRLAELLANVARDDTDCRVAGYALGLSSPVVRSLLNAVPAKPEVLAQPRTWQTEFPDYDDGPFCEAIQLAPFFAEDTSWHNDTTPTFWIKDRLVTVFADYYQPYRREHRDCARFTLVRTSPDGEYQAGSFRDCETWSEMVDEIVKFPVYTEGHLSVIRTLCASIQGMQGKVAVVDGLGRIDTHPNTGVVGPIAADDPHRFGVRSRQHVEVYGLRVVWDNWSDRGE